MWRNVVKLWLIVLALGMLLIPARPAVMQAGLGVVKGRVELINTKVKARGGKVDRSGVVIWLEPLGGARVRGGRARRTIIQRHKRFTPHITAVELGTEVDFPNEDPFFHNVFSVYHGKRFDLGLYASGETRPVLFNRPGVSYIFCNIHPQMSAVVVTLNTPYFAISDQNGDFTINGVAEGRYRLRVWHERAKSEQLEACSRIIHVTPGSLELGALQLSEEGYIPQPHKNKYGEEYETERNKPLYRRS